ncbi:hypothetical protein EDD86DRAFT_209237 [Gorgonomyces haynaldii]|nr:hypothetical protein EDD86DRAFT_209237 [Gorgonomyces haynaldii]
MIDEDGWTTIRPRRRQKQEKPVSFEQTPQVIPSSPFENVQDFSVSLAMLSRSMDELLILSRNSETRQEQLLSFLDRYRHELLKNKSQGRRESLPANLHFLPNLEYIQDLPSVPLPSLNPPIYFSSPAVAPASERADHTVWSPVSMFTSSLWADLPMRRTRSTSWTSTTMPTSHPERMAFSPPGRRRHLTTTDLASDLEKKQQKAQEIRDMVLQMRAQKTKYNTNKAQAVLDRNRSQEEQRKQLKEKLQEKLQKAEQQREERLRSIKIKSKEEDQKLKDVNLNSQQKQIQIKEKLEEKLQRAEQQREEHLRIIQHKKKEDDLKREEVQTNNTQHMEAKKQEAMQKFEDAESRRNDMTLAKMKKLQDVTAMQDAAHERRKQQEEEKLRKIEQEQEKRTNAVAKAEALKAKKVAQSQGRLKRIQDAQISKQAEEEEMRRERQEKLSEKLEQGSMRKFEQIQQVKEKAAAANHNAKIVASRVQASRKTPEKSLSFFIASEDTQQSVGFSSETKQVLQKLKDQIKQQNKSYNPPSVQIVNDKLRKLLLSVDSKVEQFTKQESSTLGLDQGLEKINKLLKTLEPLMLNQVMPMLGDFICALGFDSLKPIRTQLLLLQIIFRATEHKSNGEHITRACLLPHLIEQLAHVLNMHGVVQCWMEPATLIMKSINNCLAHTAGELYYKYAIESGILEQLVAIFTHLHAPVELGPDVSFIEQCLQFLESMTRNDSSIFDTEHSEYQQLVIQRFTDNNLIGVVTLLDALLLFKDGTCRVQPDAVLEDVWLQMSLNCFKMLNHLCQIDLNQVQSLLSDSGMCAELFHLMFFWLQYHTIAAQKQLKLQRECLSELLLLLGRVCLDNHANTAMVRLGLGDPLIKRLVQLPFEYFCNPVLQSVLLPTLVVLCVGEDDVNRLIVEDEMSMLFLKMYIANVQDNRVQQHSDKRMHLSQRLRPATVQQALELS